MPQDGPSSLVECPTTLLDDDCPACLRAVGRLCHFHERGVLPQLAVNLGWLRLMGEARIEQVGRQSVLPPVDKAAVAKIARRNARKVAKSKRGGYFGLAKAILAKG